MMDIICSSVIEKILSLAPLNRYIVLSEVEILDCFPENSERSVAELRRVLKELTENGYIDLKYSGGDMYCVAALKEIDEPQNTKECDVAEEIWSPQPKYKGYTRQYLINFFAAFFGGALGGTLAALIWAAVL